MMNDRLQREREFHNRVFATKSRSRVWKYYEVQREAKQRYAELLAGCGSGSRVLEYGCGPGSYAFDLAAAGSEVVGIDISDTAIELAAATAEDRGVSDHTTFLRMDAEHLEFPDSRFDLVCGTSIIHHLDVDAAYRQITRVLSPTGSAIFLEALGQNPALNLYRRLTPSMRTVDEHPLKSGDLAIPARYFRSTSVEHFALTTFFSLPLSRTNAFDSTLEKLERLDRCLFSASATLRNWSWCAILYASNPKQRTVALNMR